MSEIVAAEERMLSIEKRLQSIESTKASENSSSDIQQALAEYQQQILVKLKAVRDQISAEGGDVSVIKKERDDAVNENTLLKKEIEKLNYRVQHLVKALNKAEQDR